MKKIVSALFLSILLVGCSGRGTDSPKVDNSIKNTNENQEKNKVQEEENDDSVVDDASNNEGTTFDSISNGDVAANEDKSISENNSNNDVTSTNEDKATVDNSNNNSGEWTMDNPNPEGFAIAKYLNDNYSLRGVDGFKGVYYELTGEYNEEIGRISYDITMNPIEMADDELITGAIQRVGTDEGSEEDQRIVNLICDTAFDIINIIPKVSDEYHVNAVYWASMDLKFERRLARDLNYYSLQ